MRLKHNPLKNCRKEELSRCAFPLFAFRQAAEDGAEQPFLHCAVQKSAWRSANFCTPQYCSTPAARPPDGLRTAAFPTAPGRMPVGRSPRRPSACREGLRLRRETAACRSRRRLRRDPPHTHHAAGKGLAAGPDTPPPPRRPSFSHFFQL